MHSALYQARDFHRFNKRSRTVELAKRHFICNGSYLDFWNSYGQVKAYQPGTKGNAMVTFRGDKHEVEVSFV